MICVSVGRMKFTDLSILLQNEEFVEIRIDLNDFSDDELTTLFSSPAKTIATCRTGKFPEEEKIRKLKLCMESGASFVDIEFDAVESTFNMISAFSKKTNCSMIVSHHDYEKTPPVSELRNIYRSCCEKGADIVKISTFVKDLTDNAKLLSLYSIEECPRISPVIAIGMGEKGKITRASAPLLGAPFTYASREEGKETADGQIAKSVLKEFYKWIKDEE